MLKANVSKHDSNICWVIKYRCLWLNYKSHKYFLADRLLYENTITDIEMDVFANLTTLDAL